MTTPRRGFGELPPTIVVEPQIRTSAGSPVTARILITNRALEPRVMSVTTLGVDADWLPRPSRSRPLMPGETVAADLTFDPTSGTIPAVYPLAVAVQALDPVGERATSATAIAETALVVDAPGQVDVQVRPTESSAYLRRRITVLVNNSGAEDEYVRLEVHSTEAAEVKLDYETIEVPAGAVVPVRGRIHVRGRAFGRPQRFSYTVSARGSGSPRRVEGAVTTKAFFGNSATKFFVLCAIVAMWGAAAIIFIPKLASSIQNNQNKASDKVAAAQASAEAKGATPSGGASGSGGKSGGAGGSAGSAGGAAAGANGASSIQLAGTIAGQQPGGVHVGITPTSLVDEAAQAASPVGVDASSFSEIGKIPQSAVVLTSPANAVQSRSTMSQTDGTWSFGSVKAPGYYLLVFAKPGYQTQQYIVDSSSSAATQPLAVTLVPGQGTLSGHITGPSGQVGAAQISISDGTNTITTSSNSKGDVGGWTVTGLSTPDSYVVTAGQNGLSTESRIVTLAAGGSSVVNLALKAGVGSLLGRVIGPNSLGEVGGLGGVQITATDGTNTRTASSVTPPTNSRSNIAGDFTLPDLPPGKYTLTAAETGYLPQTQSVTIKAGVSSVHVPTIALQSATASVTGRVVNNTLAGVNGAGLVLSSATNTYKSITGSDGEFRIDGVTPGGYTLSAQLFGFGTVYANVVAVAGQTVVVPTKAMTLQAQSFISNNSITGFIASAVSPSGTVTCFNVATSSSSSSPSSSSSSAPSAPCTITLSMTDDAGNSVLIAKKPASNTVATYANNVVLTPSTGGPTQYDMVGEIAGSTAASPATPLPAGLYHITIHATGFLTATVNVRVPFDGVGTAPQVNLFPADTIAGTIGGPGTTTGGLQNDGPPASVPGVLHPPYANCVWVFPTDELPTSVPTSCPTQPTSSTAPLVPPTPLTSIPPARCDTSGLPDVRMAVIGTDGTYKIENLCDGSYQAYLVVTNPWYVATTSPEVETVQHGQTATYSPTISRLGHVVLTINVIGQDGSVTQATAGPGTANCGGISFGDTTKIANGKLTIEGVASGPVTCVVTLDLAAPAGTATGTATGTVSVTANNNNDTQATLNLTQTVNSVWGQIVSHYGATAGSPHPVANANVTLSGITGYDGTAPTTKTVTVATDSNGCFAFTKAGGGGSGAPASSPCAGATASPTAFPVVNRELNLTVAQGVGIKGIPTEAVTFTTSENTFVSTPIPDSTSPLVLKSSTPADLAAAKITVTPAAPGADGAGSISAAPDPSQTSSMQANLTWTDSIIGQTNLAWPGTYTVTASLAGFGTATATATCPFNVTGTQTCTFNQDLSLSALGGLNGQIIAILGDTQTYVSTDINPINNQPITESYPTQLLPGATVSLAHCSTGAAVVCPNWTTTPSPMGMVQAVTDSGGNFTIGQTLQPGPWTVRVTAVGYTTWITSITIAGGSNDFTNGNAEAPRNWLFETPVTFNVGINTGTGLLVCPTGTPTCASVTLHRVDTAQGDIVRDTQNTAHRYEFDNLNPGTYAITINGDGLRQTTTQFTVPLGATQPLDIPVTLIQNTISGSVLGSQGKSTTPVAINGIPVTLGHMSGTTFVPDNDASGHPLTQQTATIAGIVGAYSFTNVPNGSYVVEFNSEKDANGNPVTGFNENYQTQNTAPTFVSVNGGQAVSEPTFTLTRVTHTVTFTVTTTANGDDVSGATNVQLTNTTDNTWIIGANPATSAPVLGPAGQGVVDTWVIQNVPVGSWKLSITLPSGHFGQLTATSGSPAMTCTAGSAATPVSCSATVAVHGGSAGHDVTASYGLDEFQVGLHVVLSKLATDPNAATAPSTVNLTVSDGTNTVYSSGTFAVGGTAPTATFWGATGTSYSSSITGTPANWQPVAQTFTSGSPNGDITLKELGATVKIVIANAPAYNAGAATLSFAPDASSGITYTTPDSNPSNGDTVVLTASVPFGSYTVGFSGSFMTTAAGPPPVTTTHTVGGTIGGVATPTSVTVNALTQTITITPTVTP